MKAGALFRPLTIGTPEQFSALRSALEQLDYTEPAICRRVGIESIFAFRTIREDRQAGLEMKDALDALIRLLMDEEVISGAELQPLLPPQLLETMEQLGVVQRIQGQLPAWYATVVLYPVTGLYAASDRTFLPGHTEPQNLPADAVYAAITGNTRRFLSVLPLDPCDDFLDLCAGTGIGALVAGARFAKRAWAADLGSRCAHFAEFNRLLNGLDNVTSVQGDLYDAVAGLTFDRIVAHPPYVPNKDRELLFRDGGEDGEQILARIIQGLPQHLRPGGRFYCVTVATDRENEQFEQRIRRWLGESESEFDVILLATELRKKPEAMLQAVIKAKGRLGELGTTSQLFEKLKVTGIFYGTVVIERRTGPRAVATARTSKAANAGGEAVEWLRRWETAAAAPEFLPTLLAARPRLAPHMTLQVTHVARDGKLEPSVFVLRSKYPFECEGKSEAWVAALVAQCNGSHTGHELYSLLRTEGAISPETGEIEFAAVLRLLVSNAFLELPAFPLPEGPGLD